MRNSRKKKQNTDILKKGRREFIKAGMTGLFGASVLPTVLRSNPGHPARAKISSQKKDNVLFRTLGKTGIRMPIVSIGAVSQDAGLYKTALDAGIQHIDTSQYYLNGSHERVIGEAIKGRPRDSIVIATSILIGSGKEGRHSTMALRDASQLVARFDSSLVNLGLDYVDIFYIAGVDSREVTLNETLLSGLKKLKKDGKTKFIGVATHQNEPEVLRAAVESKIHDVVMVAFNFRQAHRKEIKAALAEANKAGLGIVVMKPMAGAYWDKERKNPINGKAALKWVLQDENVHTSVPGINSIDQLNDDWSVMENLAFTPQEIKDLKLGDEKNMAGLYCQQCGACTTQCPNNLEISLLMRGYMYAYGYGDMARARGVIDQMKNQKIQCEDCSTCAVTCRMGFDVKSRTIDIARLKAVPEDFICS